MISEKEFIQLTKKGNLIPVYKEILGDMETPVSAYYKLAKKSKYSFLLESVEGEEKVNRISFLAKDPELVFESKGNTLKLTSFFNNTKKTESFIIENSPIDYIREIMSKFQFVKIPELSRFCGGLIGYIGYDVVKFFEKLPKVTKDDLGFPDIVLMLAKSLIIFDHLTHSIKVVNCIYVNKNCSLKEKKKLYREAQRGIKLLIKDLNTPLKNTQPNRNKNIKKKINVKSNFSRNKFIEIVNKAKKYIREGDIIQVVLSQRFEIDIDVSPFSIYRMLRALNPSPYMYYLNCNGINIVGASPEMLVRCENGIVETRPIAGTRPRGKDESEDILLAKDLLSDPKEKAEHIMLVDLGRNDLGRICKKGSVYLSEFMNIEKYSHVMHIVSNVKGTLRKDKDSLDILPSAFPAGTVSGAPKIRAMEIIEELEGISRGPYAGCIGYFTFSGDLNTCITIRTIVIKGKKAYIQAGAGIVADSDPKKEYQETINKAKAQIRAIELASLKIT